MLRSEKYPRAKIPASVAAPIAQNFVSEFSSFYFFPEMSVRKLAP